MSEAAFGVTGDSPGAGPRLKSLARAVIYAGFSYLTFTVIAGKARSQVILAALGLVIFGIYGLCEARWRRV